MHHCSVQCHPTDRGWDAATSCGHDDRLLNWVVEQECGIVYQSIAGRSAKGEGEEREGEGEGEGEGVTMVGLLCHLASEGGIHQPHLVHDLLVEGTLVACDYV